MDFKKSETSARRRLSDGAHGNSRLDSFRHQAERADSHPAQDIRGETLPVYGRVTPQPRTEWAMNVL